MLQISHYITMGYAFYVNVALRYDTLRILR